MPGLRYRLALTLDEIAGSDLKREYMHLFFEMPNGTVIAFFDDPASADAHQFAQKDGFDVHIAFEITDEADLIEWKKKLKADRIKCAGPLDHEFVKSIYFYDPNGYQCEITCRTAQYGQILDHEETEARHVTAEWTERTRKLKESKFGAAALDTREISEFFHS